jgi:hypothetical protein
MLASSWISDIMVDRASFVDMTLKVLWTDGQDAAVSKQKSQKWSTSLCHREDGDEEDIIASQYLRRGRKSRGKTTRPNPRKNQSSPSKSKRDRKKDKKGKSRDELA